MRRALVVATVLLGCALSQAEAFSFLSQVFYRAIFPKPQPQPEPEVVVTPPPSLHLGENGRSKSIKERVDDEMASSHSPEKMLENLILTLIYTSREIVPDDFELDDDTYDIPLSGKLHVRKGKVSGVRSYGDPTLRSSIDKEGNTVFTVELHFANLVATFDSIQMDLPGSFFDKEGRGTFRVRKNKFLVKLRVVKKDKIFEKMTKNDCVVFVKYVDIAEVSDVAVDIYNAKNQRAFYTSAIVDVAIVSFEQMLKEQLTLAISKWMWDLLPDKDSRFCRDSKLHDMIELITEEQERHKLEESRSGNAKDHSPDQKGQDNAQPQTGYIRSVMDWWRGNPGDKKEATENKPATELDNNKGNSQNQG